MIGTVRALIRNGIADRRRDTQTRKQQYREVKRQLKAAGLPVPRYKDGTWDRRRHPRAKEN